MKRLLSTLLLSAVFAGVSPLSESGNFVFAANGPDTDADGVADVLDCAPADPSIAAYQLYYWDLDGDQFGDAGNPVYLCSVIPFGGTSLWGGDGDDHDPRIIGRLLPKGSRTLGADVGDLPSDGIYRADLVRELGAQAVSVTLHWSMLESSPGVFDGPEAQALHAINTNYGREGLKLNLTIAPITGHALTVPGDIAAGLGAGTVRFNDPALIARFRQLLDFVHQALPDVSIASIQVGHNVDEFLVVKPAISFWVDYNEFFLSARANVRHYWGDVKVGVTATSTGLVTEPTAGLMQQLNSGADIVSVTYFPRQPDFSVPDPYMVPFDVASLVARAYPKPLSFQGVGYPSSPRLGSSTTRQAQFVTAFFDTWDMFADHISFAAFSRLHDFSASRAATEVPSGITDPSLRDAAAAWNESLGLRTWAGSGEHKPAYQTLRTQSMNRGWWEVRPSPSRSFLLGFTPAPYDHNPGGDLIPEVLAALKRDIDSRSDFVAFHFDNGVPWVEAFTDTFASEQLPYSQHVRNWWSAHKQLTPEGARVLVALNPLGIPRSRLAPYWGTGEGFYHDAQFNLVGTGVIQDYQDRLLPAPWNTYRLNSPQVKTAYLNYAKRAVDYFGANYLVTGIEVNLAFQEDPSFFDEYVDLQRFVYESLKGDSRYAHVKVMFSFVAEPLITDEFGVSMVEGRQQDGIHVRHLEALDRLAPYCDLIGLSLYPIKTRYLSHQIPAVLIDDLMVRIRSITSKPIAITETGYPAANFEVQEQVFRSSPEKQARYLRFLMAELEKHGGVELITHFAVRDMVDHLDKLRARSLETPPFVSPVLIEFFKYFEFIGLLDDEGNARAALEVFDEAFNRQVQGANSGVAPISLRGPDNRVEATMSVSEAGHLQYQLRRNGVEVLAPSPLGVTVDGVDLGGSITNLTVSAARDHISSYAMLGARATGHDRHREWTVTARRADAADTVFQFLLRLYEDGAAYRYIIPGAGTRLISGEATGWRLPAGSIVWHHTNTHNYEAGFREAPIGAFNDDLAGPLTVDLPGTSGFLSLGEAALRNYSGLTFDADLSSELLRAEFLDDANWPVDGGGVTPWRVTIAVDSLHALVSSDLFANANDPPDPSLFPDGPLTTWIRPGKAVWSWWSDFYSGYSLETQVQYVHYAAQMNAEYSVVDAWWELGFPGGGLDQFQRLAQLAAYARQDGRNVGIWVWKSWFELIDPATRRLFLRRVKDAGVVGVKIDNVFATDSESFLSVQMYEQILRDAAELQLMVNFHGANKATGLSRTYPNEITREGLMGLEVNAILWNQGGFVSPHHNAALPFVRMIAGPGDYTPVTFDPRKMGATTVTHQLALAGLFTSPVMHFADHPGVLQWYPEAQELLRTVPTTWDETLVLPFSEIGRVAALARKKGDRWYLFAINGDAQASRRVQGVALPFLAPGEYTVSILGDATKNSFRQESRIMTADDALDMDLLPAGGFVASLTPVNAGSSAIGYEDIAGLYASKGVAGELMPAAAAMSAPLPRGSRILSIDATPTQIADEAVETAKFFFGVQGVQLMIDWKDIETAPGVYDVSLLRAINNYYSAKQLSLSLTIRPVDAIHKNVPADLMNVRFDEPQMMYRFAALLDQIFVSMPDVTIASLGIGNEVDEYFRVNPETLAQYKPFYDFAVYYTKLRRPDMKVGFSANLHALTTSANANWLQALNEWSDVILVLYYPLSFDFTVRGPSVVRGDVDALVARYWYKPIHFREAGYPSSPTTGGTLEQQRQFYEEMFKVWDSYPDNIELISFFRLTDFSPEQVEYYAGYYQQSQSPQFRAFLDSLGMRTWFGGGEWKPAFLQFYYETRSRGW